METQHYLVPLDFSEHADKAFQYAIELAQKVPAHLTLLHVIHTMPLGVTEIGASLPYAYLQEMEAGIAQAMDAYLQRVRAAKLRGAVKTVHGVPFQEIVECAKTDKVDLIIMGTHGRTGLQHALLGSVAEKVVRLAPCSVLVTRLT